MTEKEVGKFMFCINAIQDSNGNVDLETETASHNISIESVILLMKCYLKLQEHDYFEDYKNSVSKFKA
ncbi:MAG TPA: hypothetical protein VJB94_03300 [Candidatus Nanoarchaeia archaeon]|nr:hypothetical protein [Candidatus Nanoarchaeia archaeon]